MQRNIGTYASKIHTGRPISKQTGQLQNESVTFASSPIRAICEQGLFFCYQQKVSLF